jgi:hypothetical protein
LNLRGVTHIFPGAGSSRRSGGDEGEQTLKERDRAATLLLNQIQPYDLRAHVAHDTDSGEEAPDLDFGDWARSVDDLAHLLMDALVEADLLPAEFVRQCDVNQVRKPTLSTPFAMPFYTTNDRVLTKTGSGRA